MSKKRIAIVAGGDSSEHDVSLKSAAGILSWMDKDLYDAQIVELQGADLQTLNRIVDFDFAFITIHGTPGENGLLQGFLEMMRVPYSCCGVLPAALTFNKYACNHYLQDFGIKIAKSILLRRDCANRPIRVMGHEGANAEELIINEVGLPCFIKSNVGGSSFGCTKVKTAEQIAPAIEKAFNEGNEVICESFMRGTEITCGVVKTTKRAMAFPITEVVSKNEFFDYDAKYKGEVEEITPARIPDKVRAEVQAMTLRIYDILGCRGIIRTDYILIPKSAGSEEMDICLLEVNTTPGMTPTSFIPQQVRAAGLQMSDVLTAIIEER